MTFDSVERAIDAVKRGEFVVVVDDEDRENEGDLIIAAEKMVGRAPLSSRNSAMGLLPTCEAASMQASQSPKPQSTDARASEG